MNIRERLTYWWRGLHCWVYTWRGLDVEWQWSWQPPWWVDLSWRIILNRPSVALHGWVLPWLFSVSILPMTWPEWRAWQPAPGSRRDIYVTVLGLTVQQQVR